VVPIPEPPIEIENDRRSKILLLFMSARRVVVTGLGLLSPLGTSVKQSWTRLTAGESGIVSLLTHPSTASQKDAFTPLPSTVAGIIPDNSWLDILSRDDQRKMGRFAQLAVAASEEALRDAQLDVKELSPAERERIVFPCFGITEMRVFAADQELEVLRML